MATSRTTSRTAPPATRRKSGASADTSPTASRKTGRATSRAAASARSEILTQLKDDHKRVKKAYREFQKMDLEQDPEACQALVLKVLDELTVHAKLEEEVLYPAARGAIADTDLVDEAEVEHESVHALIEQLRGMTPEDEKYAARFTVLCEYVTHHVKEEENEMFPQLEAARLDWEALAAEMNQRRQALTATAEPDADDEAEPAKSNPRSVKAAAKPARGTRSNSVSVGNSQRLS